MVLTAEQLQELDRAGKRHPKPGVRIKALAILAVGEGQPRAAVARMFRTSLTSLGSWLQRYGQGGLAALEIAPGRGRKSAVDPEQVLTYALQSPQQFGIARSRWTLRLLAEAVPCLHGYSETGVLRVLHRVGLSYKRGQPWLPSPDPDYEKKRQVIAAGLEQAQAHPGAVVLLFEDEASFYRQPSQAPLLGLRGPHQPRVPRSQRGNTRIRVAGTLDAVAGHTCFRQAFRYSVPELLKFYRQVLAAYPAALMIYLVQDNWPVHFHEDVEQFLARQPRLQVLRLPTYAPWLNPIEKAWKWARQHYTHAHRCCDDFPLFRRQLDECLNEATQHPEAIKQYCGLNTLKIYS
jgi:transposase